MCLHESVYFKDKNYQNKLLLHKWKIPKFHFHCYQLFYSISNYICIILNMYLCQKEVQTLYDVWIFPYVAQTSSPQTHQTIFSCNLNLLRCTVGICKNVAIDCLHQEQWSQSRYIHRQSLQITTEINKNKKALKFKQTFYMAWQFPKNKSLYFFLEPNEFHKWGDSPLKVNDFIQVYVRHLLQLTRPEKSLSDTGYWSDVRLQREKWGRNVIIRLFVLKGSQGAHVVLIEIGQWVVTKGKRIVCFSL